MKKLIFIFLGALFLLSCEDEIISKENTCPTATFIYYPIYLDTSTIVTFDASLSKDEESEDLTYKWNFEKNNWTNMSKYPCESYKFSSAGEYVIQLKVFDEQGWSSTVTKTIIVN